MSYEDTFNLYDYIDLCLVELGLEGYEFIEVETRLCKSCKNKKDVDKQIKKLKKKYA